VQPDPTAVPADVLSVLRALRGAGKQAWLARRSGAGPLRAE